MSTNARRSRARNRRTSRLNKIKLIAVAILLGVILSLFGAMSAVALVAIGWLDDLPDYSDISAFETSLPSRIYSAEGTLMARFMIERREPVEFEEISPYLIQAIVAVEDERFFDHEGVDPQGIARAAVATMTGGLEGGSTITQQFVRQTILRDEMTDISLRRKFREAYLALEVERQFDKEQILTMYLNTVNFGSGAYGIQVASLTYFGIPASELNLPQAAALAGIPQSPNALSPLNNKDRTKARRAHVLNRMYENDLITYEERRAAEADPMELDPDYNPEHGIIMQGYFVSHVRRELQQGFEFSEAEVFQGGLSVHTTLRLPLQHAAEQAVWNMIGDDPDRPEGALVAQEVDTGKIIAMVGGRDFREDNFNLATQAMRQPGSSFKTFGMVAAIELGMSPNYGIDTSSPARIGSGPNPWVVHNAGGGRGSGVISLRASMAASMNTSLARLAYYGTGAEAIVDVAQRMGITSDLQPFPSIVLGAQEVTVLDMATAYATLASGGIHRQPVFITDIYNRDGEHIFEWEITEEEALTPEVSWASTQVLMGTITGGTGSRARLPNWQVAGKTGTSQENRDVWFAGYTPVLSTAVWVGHKEEAPIWLNGSIAFGGTVCAPIWRAFMEVALQEYEHRLFATAAAPPFDNSLFSIPVIARDNDDDADDEEEDEEEYEEEEQDEPEPPPAERPPATPPAERPPPSTDGGNQGGGTGGNQGGSTGGNQGGSTGGGSTGNDHQQGSGSAPTTPTP